MRVIVVGGGAVGIVLCRLLSKEEKISSIACCDIKEIKQSINKVKFFKVNTSDKKELEKFLKKKHGDYVINTATSWLNITLMEACLAHGLNYMDLSSMWNPSKSKKAKSPYKVEQLDYHDKFKKKKIFGLINAGVAPGIDNLLARQCADELDEVDTIKIRLIDHSGSEEMYFSWSKQVLLDELASKPLIYQDGEFKQADAFSGLEEFEFPEPFGKKPVNLICQEELGTIPLYIKVKNVDEKDYDDQMPKQKFLYAYGFLSKEKIKVGGCKISPLDFTCKILPEVSKAEELKKYGRAQFAMLVQAEGKKGEQKIMVRNWAVFPTQEEIDNMQMGANFMTYPTAISTKLFVMVLDKITEKGVFPPEALEKQVREEIINELAKCCAFKKEIINL